MLVPPQLLVLVQLLELVPLPQLVLVLVPPEGYSTEKIAELIDCGQANVWLTMCFNRASVSFSRNASGERKPAFQHGSMGQ